MVSTHFASAIPSLFCLVVFCFIPKTAHDTFNLWRALQIYDGQEVDTQKIDRPTKGFGWATLATSVCVLISLLSFLVFLLTSGFDWHDTYLPLDTLRKAFPILFLFAVVNKALSKITVTRDRPMVSVSRKWNSQGRQQRNPRIILSYFSSESQLDEKEENIVKVRGIARNLILTLLIMLYSFQAFGKQSSIMIVTVSLLSSHIYSPHLPQTWKKHASIRGMILLSAALYTLFLASFFLEIIVAMMNQRAFQSSNNELRIDDKISTFSMWTFGRMDLDLALVQLIALYNPFVWIALSSLPIHLVHMAYRYDAAQLLKSKGVSNDAPHFDHKDQVPTDASERIPVFLHTAALPRSAFSASDLPTTRAALSTLVFVQAAGSTVDVLTGWQNAVVFPTEAIMLPLRNNLVFSIWPILAYPLVIIAMLMSVSRNPDRSLNSFWTYSERWDTEGRPSVTEVQNPEKEKYENPSESSQNLSFVFGTVPLSAGASSMVSRITCSVPFDDARQILYGANDGVYWCDLRQGTRQPTRILSIAGVTQVDVLQEYQMLIVLAEQSIHIFPFDAQIPSNYLGGVEQGMQISRRALFFKTGQLLGRTLVCIGKTLEESTMIKVMEPIRQQSGERRYLGQYNLRVFKTFFIPINASSAHFLSSKLCFGGIDGFRLVDLESLEEKSLLDPADSMTWSLVNGSNLQAIAIYKIDGQFLLCYDKMAFFVDRHGRRSREEWMIRWEGNPTSFAFHYPYLFAIDTDCINVHHVHTGALVQVITGSNLRSLYVDLPSSTYGSPSMQVNFNQSSSLRQNNATINTMTSIGERSDETAQASLGALHSIIVNENSALHQRQTPAVENPIIFVSCVAMGDWVDQTLLTHYEHRWKAIRYFASD